MGGRTRGGDRFVPAGAAGERRLLREAGVALPQDLAAEAAARQRFARQPPSAARIVAWQQTAGADQTIDTTAWTALTNTTFALGLGGAAGERWLLALEGTAYVHTWGAVGDVFRLRFEVSRDDGATWAVPDTDRTTQGAAGASAWHDLGLAEAAGTGAAVQVRCRCAFFALPSERVQVRLAASVDQPDDVATVGLTSATSAPRVLGTAIAVRVP